MSNPTQGATQTEEYKCWKDNSTFLYKFLAVHTLEWPSLSVEFLQSNSLCPRYQNHRNDYDGQDMQTILLGTHTTQNEANYMILMDVAIPSSPLDLGHRIFEKQYDYDGFCYGRPEDPKFHLRKKIPHYIGEPNRIRAMPGNVSVIATISVGGTVTIYNLDKVLSNDQVDVEADALTTLSLMGHESEGWGLAWSTTYNNYLATAANDGLVCVWDISNRCSDTSSSTVKPLLVLDEHQGAVEDVTWQTMDGNLLYSVADDGKCIIWDTKQSESQSLAQSIQVSSAPLNAVALNYRNPIYFATGGDDRDITIWDTRNLSNSLYKLTRHSGPVSKLAFSRKEEEYLMSSSVTSDIFLWNLKHIGKEQSIDDAQNGPPELIFSHSGHYDTINDFDWNPNFGFERLILSVSGDNKLAIWEPTELIFDNEEDDTSLENDGDDFTYELVS